MEVSKRSIRKECVRRQCDCDELNSARTLDFGSENLQTLIRLRLGRMVRLRQINSVPDIPVQVMKRLFPSIVIFHRRNRVE